MLKVITWFLERRMLALLALSTTTIYFAFNLSNLRVDTSQDSMFEADDPEMIYYHQFVKDFGSDEVLGIYFEVQDLFNVNTFQMIDELTHKFGKIKGVEEVISVTNYKRIFNRNGVLTIQPIEDELAYWTQISSDIRKEIQEDALLFKLQLISRNYKGAAFLLPLEKNGDPAYRSKIIKEVRRINEESERVYGIHFYIGGSPFGEFALEETFKRDMGIVGPLMLMMVILILLFIFRSPLYSALPLLVIMMSCIWTFGFVAAMGWKVTPITEIALPLLLVYGILASVYFLNAYRNIIQNGVAPKDAILNVVDQLWKPCFYASMTTAVGFASLTVSSVSMVEYLGLYSAFGILVSLMATFLVLPLILSSLPLSLVGKTTQSNSFLSGFLHEVRDGVARYEKSVLLGAFIVMGILGYWSFGVIIDTDTLKLFKENSEAVHNEAAGKRIMGPWAPIEFSVEAGDGYQLDDPVLLREIEKLGNYLEGLPHIGETLSIVDILEKARQELHGGDKRFYSIPDTVTEVKHILGFIELVGGERGLHSYLREDLMRTRITARSEFLSARQHTALFEEIEKYIVENMPSSIKIKLTGHIWLGQKLLNRILYTEIQSFSLAFLMIFLLIAFSLRSWRLALVAIPPNIFPVVVILGMMGKFGINLDVGTCTVASIVIAMAVDDTIHFLHRFKQEIEEKKDYSIAIMATMEKVGPPIVYTSLVLMVGFWVLIFSSYVPALNFGFLSGVAVLAALVGDIVILPALLMWTRPIRFVKPMWGTALPERKWGKDGIAPSSLNGKR